VGLRVEQIEITGLKRMDRMSVYAVALEDKQNETSMMSVDLEGIRQKLLRYGWIADAHVSRRLPDTLLVDIVERTPAAVWQDRGELTLIDAHGVLLEPVRPDAIPDLPLVIGPGADRQEASYQALLSAAPALKPRIKAATWIGNRRWDLTFESGETLALPEEGAPAALLKFAELDGARPLLGRGWLRFDMRDTTKLVARKPGMNQNHALADPAETGEGEASAPSAPATTAGAVEG
jgi:cell division protein FtsQ